MQMLKERRIYSKVLPVRGCRILFMSKWAERPILHTNLHYKCIVCWLILRETTAQRRACMDIHQTIKPRRNRKRLKNARLICENEPPHSRLKAINNMSLSRGPVRTKTRPQMCCGCLWKGKISATCTIETYYTQPTPLPSPNRFVRFYKTHLRAISKCGATLTLYALCGVECLIRSFVPVILSDSHRLYVSDEIYMFYKKNKSIMLSPHCCTADGWFKSTRSGYLRE